MKLILLLAALVASSLIVSSCLNRGPASTLTINGGADHSKLRISNVQADVTVGGRVTETTLWITFYNNTGRTLKAKVDLPLPEGASITAYALEVNGKMCDGVLLGRVAFENTIRQNIDPGLFEKTAGNNFRTRIYPIFSKGSKKLKLTYIEPLRSKDGSLGYTLPINFKNGVDKFSLNLDVDSSTVVSNHSGDLSDGDYTRRASSFRSRSPNPFTLKQKLETSAFS